MAHKTLLTIKNHFRFRCMYLRNINVHLCKSKLFTQRMKVWRPFREVPMNTFLGN